MLNRINIQKISIPLVVISWGLLLIFGLSEQYYYSINPQHSNSPMFLKGLLLNFFIVSTYYATKIFHERVDIDFHNLIWRVFIVGVITALSSGILNLFLSAVDKLELSRNVLLHTLFFHIEYGAFIVFLMTAYASWKKMILYEKTKFTQSAWNLFEFCLLASLVTHFIRLGKIDIYFSLPAFFFGILILLLCVNLRWIPHLNFNQKLVSIFQLFAILVCIYIYSSSIKSYYGNQPLVVDDLSVSTFSAAILMFVTFYTGGSLVVIIFNLPTSSVFEKKFQEISLSQKLSDSILEGKSEEHVYQVLLETSVTTVKADAAFLDVPNHDLFLEKNISKWKVTEIKEKLKRDGYDNSKLKRYNTNPFLRDNRRFDYNSLLAVPIRLNDKSQGTLVLLKDLNNGFDGVMVAIINTFVTQAAIAIHNFHLISQVLENERYKGELQIARRVQERLLPESTGSSLDFEIYAKSEPTQEVGGDYYDFHKISENKYAIIIADVAGKGIPAAFNMAQMKGIFQTLVRMYLDPATFFKYANAALSDCLERGAFITATYFFVDTEYKKIYFSRAGHCPTLFYNKEKDEVSYFESKGLGLGILRNEKFDQHVETDIFQYHEGDLMLLYTDGIIEARQESTGDLYGYDRLKDYLEANHDKDLSEIYYGLIQDIFKFTENTEIEDDFTILLVRF